MQSGHYKIYLVRLIGHAYTSCFLSFLHMSISEIYK
jgi:hypothetical protein